MYEVIKFDIQDLGINLWVESNRSYHLCADREH